MNCLMNCMNLATTYLNCEFEQLKPSVLSKRLLFLTYIPRLFLPNSVLSQKLMLQEQMLAFVGFVVECMYAKWFHGYTLGNVFDTKMPQPFPQPFTNAFLELAFQLGFCVKESDRYQFPTPDGCYKNFDIFLFEKWVEQEDLSNIRALKSSKSKCGLFKPFLKIFVLVKINRRQQLSLSLLQEAGVSMALAELAEKGEFACQLTFCESLIRLLKGGGGATQGYPEIKMKACMLAQASNKTLAKIIKRLNRELPMRHMLDVGSGAGESLIAAHNAVAFEHIYGIEQDRSLWLQNRPLFLKYSNISYINQNFFDYNSNLRFDLVLLKNVLPYFKQEEKHQLMKQISYLLSPQGKLILSISCPKVELLKAKMAFNSADLEIGRQIDMFYANKFLYAQSLVQENMSELHGSDNWQELVLLFDEYGFVFESIENADRQYASLYVVVKKKDEESMRGLYGEGI